MTNIRPIPTNDQLYDQASQWIVKMDKGLSADEETALQEWLQTDQQAYSILMEMTQLWDKMDAMSRLSDLFAKPQSSASPSTANQSPQSHWRGIGAIAASLVLATSLGLWVAFDTFNPFSTGNIYQTAIGEQSTVTLADGSQITLNTNTSVEVQYSEHARHIHLSSGELHVSVAKDPSRPLSVMAAGQIIQAVGTEFNIEITDQQNIELMVTEGKVRVGIHQNPIQTVPSDSDQPLPAEPLILAAGEQIMLNKEPAASSEKSITEVSAEEIEVKLSWRQGNLIFRGESLEDAVKEINRYTSVEFVFMNEDLKKMRVAGLFKAGDVEGLLAALHENFNIISQRDRDGKVLLSN